MPRPLPHTGARVIPVVTLAPASPVPAADQPTVDPTPAADPTQALIDGLRRDNAELNALLAAARRERDELRSKLAAHEAANTGLLADLVRARHVANNAICAGRAHKQTIRSLYITLAGKQRLLTDQQCTLADLRAKLQITYSVDGSIITRQELRYKRLAKVAAARRRQVRTLVAGLTAAHSLLKGFVPCFSHDPNVTRVLDARRRLSDALALAGREPAGE